MTRPVFSLTKRRRFARQHLVLLGGLSALAFANVVGPSQLRAQAQPAETFSLPAATPSPTPSQPAPQGPADERVGVEIGPRVIPESSETTPTAQPVEPAPSESRAPTSSPAANSPVASSSPSTQERAQTPSDEPAPTQSNPQPATPSVQNADARGAGIAVDGPVDPGFETLEGEPEGLAPRGPDGWYDVDEAGSEGQAASASQASRAENTSTPPSSASIIWERITTQSEAFLALLALMAVLAAILIWVRMQRKRAEAAITDAPSTATVLTAGIRASMGDDAANPPRNDVPLGEEFGFDDDDEAKEEKDKKEAPEATGETSTEPENAPPETATEPVEAAEEYPVSDLEQETPSIPVPEPDPGLPELDDAPYPGSETTRAPETAAEAAPVSETEPADLAPATPSPVAQPIAKDLQQMAKLSPFAALHSAKPKPQVAKAKPTPPLDVALRLDIKSASRSLMRMSVEFTLEIVNRTDHAVRDLNVAGELSTAREGAAGPAPVDKTQHLTKVDRIAPRQSRRVSGTLQLLMSEITAIRQNGNPVVIPLIHFRLGTANQPAIKRTFVVGTPSATSTTRVHPLLFDGPPGGLPPLRAQLIKQA